MTQLKCINKICQHEWNYKNEQQQDYVYITCPRCHNKNKLEKLKQNQTNSETNKDKTKWRIEENE